MTLAESRFWDAVRANRLDGLPFRRQQVIEGFIADFYCNSLRLVVELDGGVHETQEGYDRFREKAIKHRGLKVLRFSNDDVVQRLDWVLDRILKLEEESLTQRPISRRKQ
jgi:very-short-patch-repair endonuclease